GYSAELGDATEVILKADLDFASQPGKLFTEFSNSLDGETRAALGEPVEPLSLDGSLTHFMGHRVGLFNYATQEVGGHVDFDHFLLSDTLTAQNLALDETELESAITQAHSLREAEYPASEWAVLQDRLTLAEAAS